MQFKALQEQSADQYEFVSRQLALGLDATVVLPVRAMRQPYPMPEQENLRRLPVRFAKEVRVRDWTEHLAGQGYPLLYREYTTPAGALQTVVQLTEDWRHSDRIALFDDFVIPPARKRLIESPADLPALRYLLTAPSQDDIARFREEAHRAKAFATTHDLLVVGEWGVLVDVACWLCGMEELIFMALDAPSFVEELLTVISDWNQRRMSVILDEGVDVLIKRAWYESADFWSPETYRRFLLPFLKRDAQTAHEAGAKLALITTSGYTPLLDFYLEAGLDVLIGLDPVQDRYADLALVEQKLGGKVCLWGGVNGCVTVETGTPDDVRQAVHEAVRVLAPGGGFILSPVDNVREWSERVLQNVQMLINTWRELR